MIEFGSDFHKCDNEFGANIYEFRNTLVSEIIYYANGRNAIKSLIEEHRWTRIWMPVYYCYEVVNYIISTGIKVLFYNDYPLAANDDEIIKKLAFEEGDVLLRINYFGLRNFRTNVDIPVPVIEDHTHSLISDWCIKSDADWCVASIRKTVPVAAGGILWSPMNHSLPKQLSPSPECENMANVRYTAMNLKANYLRDGGSKEEFRAKYLFSEEIIESLAISGMDMRSLEIIRKFDIDKWFKIKKENWHLIQGEICHKFDIVRSVDTGDMYQFSLIILCKSNDERELLRRYLIRNNVYPAILWEIPKDSGCRKAIDFSERMLSIHCDARYGYEDAIQLSKILNAYYD